MQTKTIGITLAIIGLLMMIYTGITIVTQKNVVDLGPVQINKTENHPVRWSPIIGSFILAGGIVLLVTNKKVKQQ